MTMMIRYVLFFVTVLIVMVIMIFAFKWFPEGDTIARIGSWIGFIISYAISMIISVLVTKLKERAENSKMQEALDNYNKRN